MPTATNQSIHPGHPSGRSHASQNLIGFKEAFLPESENIPQYENVTPLPCTSVALSTLQLPLLSRTPYAMRGIADAICSRMAREGESILAIIAIVSCRATASRGDLALMVEVESSCPMFTAYNISSALPPRLSPTAMRSGRMRKQLRIRSRILTSPLPSRLGGRDLSWTTCG